MAFLPTTKKEIEQLGWDVPDFVLVTGDAYVDHPTFGVAIISRLLESYGYKIAILAQPDWRTDRDFTRFGHLSQARCTATSELEQAVCTDNAGPCRLSLYAGVAVGRLRESSCSSGMFFKYLIMPRNVLPWATIRILSSVRREGACGI